jgi:hypothetical protein
MEILIHNLNHGMMITVFVFVMMICVDYINVLTRGKLGVLMRGGRFRQYTITSFLGATPGCLGAFMTVSFYVHGLVSFGAIVACMIATSGDEAFVMLVMFPGKALLLFGILFLLGIIFGYLSDRVAAALKIEACRECRHSNLHEEDEDCRCLNWSEAVDHLKKVSLVRFLFLTLLFLFIFAFLYGLIGPKEWNWIKITIISLLFVTTFIILTVPDHYMEEHIWEHIVKKHLVRVFLWSFGALLLVNVGMKYWNIEAFVRSHMFWIILLASLISIIPESGPHMIFVMMFAEGLVPFSVLLASSIVQDGHGMLPLLSYTIRDSILIKAFNLVIGLGLGIILYSLGF